MSRRARGEGSVGSRPLKDGRWQSRISWRDERGEIRRKAFYGATRAEAAAKLNKALTDHAAGVPVLDDRATVKTFLEDWLATTAKATVRPSTWACYDTNVRVHLVPALGHIRLSRLTPRDVERLMHAKIAAGKSPRTVQLMRAVLGVALNRALAWGMVARNAAELAQAPTVTRKPVEPLEGAQVRRFLEGTREDRLHALYVAAFSTGLRQGELLALRWADLDLEAGTLRVTRNLAKGRHLGEPKTQRGARTIALPGLTVEALKAHRVRQLEERLAVGAWENPELVFSNEIGGHLTPWGLTRAFKGHLRRLELPPQRFHDARHAAASLLLAEGVPARVVMEVLGHSTIHVTMNTYSHVSPALSREAAASMERAIGAI